MIEHRVVLVLGAGSSVAFGYPVGKELRNSILSISDYGTQVISDAVIQQYGIASWASEYVAFRDAFRASQMYSIDAFLAKRKEFEAIGKRCIAHVLLQHENLAILQGSSHTDLWQQYVLNNMAADTWDELDLSNLSVVTFNYDRSFEHYLMYALMASFGKSRDQAVEKLRAMKVIHMYGSLGGALPGDGNYLEYADTSISGRTAIAAAAIKVIPEGRQSDKEFGEARATLLAADSIAFLGFGFDKTNLERLNASVTCAINIARPGGQHLRKVVGTCYGLEPGEAIKAARVTSGTNEMRPGASFPYGFEDVGCLTLLRRHQVFG